MANEYSDDEVENPRPMRSASKKRFIYPRAMALPGRPLIGSGECVALIQHFMVGVGATSTWEFESTPIVEAHDLAIGTVIGNATPGGRWPGKKHSNHVAFFYLYGPYDVDKKVHVSIIVVDQFIMHGLVKIQLREIRSKGKWGSGEFIDPSNNADAFFALKYHEKPNH